MSKAYFVSSVWNKRGVLCLCTSLVRDVKNEEEAFGVHFNSNKDELMSDGFVYMMHDCMEVVAEDLVSGVKQPFEV